MCYSRVFSKLVFCVFYFYFCVLCVCFFLTFCVFGTAPFLFLFCVCVLLYFLFFIFIFCIRCLFSDLRRLGRGTQLGGARATAEPARADAAGAVRAPQRLVPRQRPQVHEQPHLAVTTSAAGQHGCVPRGGEDGAGRGAGWLDDWLAGSFFLFSVHGGRGEGGGGWLEGTSYLLSCFKTRRNYVLSYLSHEGTTFV